MSRRRATVMRHHGGMLWISVAADGRAAAGTSVWLSARRRIKAGDQCLADGGNSKLNAVAAQPGNRYRGNVPTRLAQPHRMPWPAIARSWASPQAGFGRRSATWSSRGQIGRRGRGVDPPCDAVATCGREIGRSAQPAGGIVRSDPGACARWRGRQPSVVRRRGRKSAVFVERCGYRPPSSPRRGARSGH